MGNEIQKGALYVVATPIGNLLDITERAFKTLSEVDFIAAEDTRISGKLLSHLGIKKPFVSYYEHNKDRAHQPILERLKQGQSCAIITDAGTPAISDPGEQLVRLCHENNIKVIPIPGASAAITALSASGMPTGSFVFEGFLKDKSKERREQLEMLSVERRTIILYCAPHDIKDTLSQLYEAFGNRELVIARELTKLNEEILLTTLKQATITPPLEKGEFVLVVGGCSKDKTDAFWHDMTVLEHVEHYIALGEAQMNAIKLCAKDRKVPKSEIYNEVVKNKDIRKE